MKVHTAPDVAEAMEAVRELTAEVCDDIDQDAIGTTIEPIENEHVSGFAPYTDGGWNACVTFGFYSEVSRSVTLIEPFVLADEQECIASFRSEYNLDDDADVFDHPEWRDGDYASEWEQSDECTWFVYVRAVLYLPGNRRNTTGEPEFDFGIAVNDDFNYGRDHISYIKGAGSHWLWEEVVPISALTADKVDELRTAMLDAWRAA